MFKIAVSPDFIAPVKAQLPADKGRTTNVLFHVRYKRLSQQEYQDLLRRLEESKHDLERRIKEATLKGEEASGLVPTFGDRDLLDEVLVGFEPDLQDESGAPLAFTPDNVDALCGIYPIQPAMVRSFFEHFGSAAQKK